MVAESPTVYSSTLSAVTPQPTSAIKQAERATPKAHTQADTDSGAIHFRLIEGDGGINVKVPGMPVNVHPAGNGEAGWPRMPLYVPVR